MDIHGIAQIQRHRVGVDERDFGFDQEVDRVACRVFDKGGHQFHRVAGHDRIVSALCRRLFPGVQSGGLVGRRGGVGLHLLPAGCRRRGKAACRGRVFDKSMRATL